MRCPSFKGSKQVTWWIVWVMFQCLLSTTAPTTLHEKCAGVRSLR